MKKFMTFVACTFCVALLSSTANADHIWVNEIHYDNTGADVAEFIEVGLRTPNMSGDIPSDYVIELYNNGTIYNTTLDLTMADATSAPIPVINGGATEVVTLFSFDVSGIQNGPSDGFALVNATTASVVDGLLYSYEGTFAATNGTAAGLTSVALAADEAAPLAAGGSVGATGDGFGANQFGPGSFAALTATPGAANTGQVFTRAVPEPSSIALLGLIGLAGVVRRRK